MNPPDPTPNRRQVEPTVDYYHRANEEPPAPFCGHGPITGTKKYLASIVAISLGISSHTDRRTLDSMVRLGHVWAQRIHHRIYRVWFPTKTDYDRAKQAHDDNQRRRQKATDSK